MLTEYWILHQAQIKIATSSIRLGSQVGNSIKFPESSSTTAGVELGDIKTFMAANKAVKDGDKGVNNVLQSTQRTLTKAGNCFVAGTEILTVDGIKNIEDIVVGDWVIADDPTTPGGIEAKQVLETFVRETDALVDLYVDGEVISTTGEHPFWTPDLGWVEAKDLTVGSLLQTESGKVVDVDRVEKREGKFEVYNFNVEGIPTYFVSDLGILVHNTNCGGSFSPLSIDDQQLGKKLGKHVSDFGGNPANSADRDMVRGIIEDIGNNPEQVVSGTFMGQGPDGKTRGPVDFRIKGNDVVVTKPDGTFVTI